jgi:hypothetical protein
MEKLYVRELVRIPMPHWNRVAWEGLVALLPATLFRNEVEGANYIYAQLEMLTAIRSDLVNVIAETGDVDYVDFGKLRSRRSSMTLNPRYDGPWHHAESGVAELLEKGNPIPG